MQNYSASGESKTPQAPAGVDFHLLSLSLTRMIEAGHYAKRAGVRHSEGDGRRGELATSTLEAALIRQAELVISEWIEPSALLTFKGPGGILTEVARSFKTVIAFKPSMFRAGYVSEQTPLAGYEQLAEQLIARVPALMTAAVKLQDMSIPLPYTRERELAALGKSAEQAAAEKEAALKRERQEFARRLNRGLNVPIKGRVSSASELPAEDTLGARWLCKDTGHAFFFDGVAWCDAGQVQPSYGSVPLITAG